MADIHPFMAVMRESRATGNLKIVQAAIASHVAFNGKWKGKTFVSESTIAAEYKLKLRTVEDCIARLDQDDWRAEGWEVAIHGGPGQTGREPNLYTVPSCFWEGRRTPTKTVEEDIYRSVSKEMKDPNTSKYAEEYGSTSTDSVGVPAGPVCVTVQRVCETCGDTFSSTGLPDEEIVSLCSKDCQIAAFAGPEHREAAWKRIRARQALHRAA
jgi:hypothetical protein